MAFGEIEAEPDAQVAIGRAAAQRLLERRDRRLRLAGLPVGVRERDVGIGSVGPARDHAVQQRDRLIDLPSWIELRRGVQVAIDLDEALGVVRLGVDFCSGALPEM